MSFLWFYSYLSTNDTKIFLSLGNDRPPILVQVEDRILEAIIGISAGKPRDDILDTLYLQIIALEKDLNDDDRALSWFNLATSAIPLPSTPPVTVPSTPQLTKVPSTPLAGM